MTIVVIGHRGAMGLEPENTVRSFRRAESEGADGVELDLHLSADGELVIMHDLTVDRTTNGSGPIAEMTLAEIRELDAGEGERIPTFDEVLDTISLPVQAEVKAPDAARKTVETVRRRNLVDRTTVTSFSADAVRAAKQYLPQVRTGLIMSKATPTSVDEALEVSADVVCLGLNTLTADIVAEAHRAGLDVAAWTANSPEQLLQAFRVGASAVTSDYPDLRQRTVQEIPHLHSRLDDLEKALHVPSHRA